MLVPMDPTPLTFIERGDDGARAALRRLRRRLSDDGLACRLLRGRDEPRLHLLVVEGDPVLAPDETRGARVWRFEDAPSASDADAGAPVRPGTADA